MWRAGWHKCCASPATARPAAAHASAARAQVYPIYSRFGARHALAVHGLKRPGAHEWFAERVGNSSHATPQLACRPSTWEHARAASWRVCQSWAPCEGEGLELNPTAAQLRNLSAPWLPGNVRQLCKQRLKRGAAERR